MVLPVPQTCDSPPLLRTACTVEAQRGRGFRPLPQALDIRGTLTHHHLCLQTGWAPSPGTSASCPCGGGSGGGGAAHRLAGPGAVQGRVAEMSHVRALGRQCGDGPLHGAGAGGRLRGGGWGGHPLSHSLRDGSGAPEPPGPSLSLESSSPPRATLSPAVRLCQQGAESCCLPVPGGQGGGQEEGGWGRARRAPRGAACDGSAGPGPRAAALSWNQDPWKWAHVEQTHGFHSVSCSRSTGQGQEGEEGGSHQQWDTETSLEDEVILNVQSQEPQKEVGTGPAPGQR